MAAQPWRWFIQDLVHIFDGTTHKLERDNHRGYAFLARNFGDALIDLESASTTLYCIYSNEGGSAKECSDLVIETYAAAIKNKAKYQNNDDKEHKQNDCNITKIIMETLQTKIPDMLQKKGNPHTISIKDSIRNYVKEQTIWNTIMQQPGAQEAFDKFCINPTAWEHLNTLVVITGKVRAQHGEKTPPDSKKIIDIFDYFQEKAEFRISNPDSDYFPPYYNPQSACASPQNQKKKFNVVHHPYILWRAAITHARAAGEPPRETKTDDLIPSSARSYNHAQLTVTVESLDASPPKSRRAAGVDNLTMPVSARSDNNETKQTAINHALPDEKTLNSTKKIKSLPYPKRYPMPTFRNTIGYWMLIPTLLIPTFVPNAIMDLIVRSIFKMVNYVACSHKNSWPVVLFKGILALILFPPYIIAHAIAKLSTPKGILATGIYIRDSCCDNSSEVSHIEEKIETSLSTRQQATPRSNRSSTPRPARQTTLTQSSTSSQPSDLHLSAPYLTPPSYRNTNLHSPSTIHNGLRLNLPQLLSPAPSPEPSTRTNDLITHVSIRFDLAEPNVNVTKINTDASINPDDYPEPSILSTTPPTHVPVRLLHPRRPQKIQHDANLINSPQTDALQSASTSMNNAPGSSG